MTHPYVTAKNVKRREIARLKGRISRYEINVAYYTKHPDSAALRLNRSMLLEDQRSLRQLTGKTGYQN